MRLKIFDGAVDAADGSSFRRACLLKCFELLLGPFSCDMCALSFNRQHDLKRHRDTHTGEKPFLCNGGCGKTFTRKDALKRHQVRRLFALHAHTASADADRAQLVKRCGIDEGA